MTQTILHLDASARTENSISRDLSAQIVARFKQADIIRRDLASPLPLITGEWVGANFTPADDRDEAQRHKWIERWVPRPLEPTLWGSRMVCDEDRIDT